MMCFNLINIDIIVIVKRYKFKSIEIHYSPILVLEKSLMYKNNKYDNELMFKI